MHVGVEATEVGPSLAEQTVGGFAIGGIEMGRRHVVVDQRPFAAESHQCTTGLGRRRRIMVNQRGVLGVRQLVERPAFLRDVRMHIIRVDL